jgi:putative SOS response-associated peptidase YedK
MCGRFSLKSPGRTKFDALIRSHFPLLSPRYNIAPSQAVVRIVQHADVRSAALLQWGLKLRRPVIY